MSCWKYSLYQALALFHFCCFLYEKINVCGRKLNLSYKYARLKSTLFAHVPEKSQQGNFENPNLLLWLLDSSAPLAPTKHKLWPNKSWNGVEHFCCVIRYMVPAGTAGKVTGTLGFVPGTVPI